MTGFRVMPEILRCDTVAEFLAEYPLDRKDLLITNEYIYEPYLAPLQPDCRVCFQERYGAGEPTDRMVEAMARDLSLEQYDRIIGVGGGAVMDVCKLLAQRGAGDVEGLFRGEGLERVRRLVLVPTTCGTGSEVTAAAVAGMTGQGCKMGLVNGALYCDLAVLIPELLGTLPYPVFAAGSIDALVHGIESYLHPRRNGLIAMMAEGSIAAVLSVYRRMEREGRECWRESGGLLLEASCAAGIAFSNDGCGPVHALSYALGGKYHVPHGLSNYQFLIAVLRVYEARKCPAMNELKALLGRLLDVRAEGSVDALEKLLASVLENRPMRAFGAVESDVDGFTDSTLACQRRLLDGGPILLSREDVRAIYAGRL